MAEKSEQVQGEVVSERTISGKSLRGFASMDEKKQREIASKGGRAAHQKGTAHEFDSDQARQAGRKGGETVSRNRNHMSTIGRRGGESVSSDRSHMATIGRKGGEAVSANRDHMAKIGRKGGEAVSANRQHMSEIGREGGSARASAGSTGQEEPEHSTKQASHRPLHERAPGEPTGTDIARPAHTLDRGHGEIKSRHDHGETEGDRH